MSARVGYPTSVEVPGHRLAWEWNGVDLSQFHPIDSGTDIDATHLAANGASVETYGGRPWVTLDFQEESSLTGGGGSGSAASTAVMLRLLQQFSPNALITAMWSQYASGTGDASTVVDACLMSRAASDMSGNYARYTGTAVPFLDTYNASEVQTWTSSGITYDVDQYGSRLWLRTTGDIVAGGAFLDQLAYSNVGRSYVPAAGDLAIGATTRAAGSTHTGAMSFTDIRVYEPVG